VAGAEKLRRSTQIQVPARCMIQGGNVFASVQRYNQGGHYCLRVRMSSDTLGVKVCILAP
jgi:hypothetical protein